MLFDAVRLGNTAFDGGSDAAPIAAAFREMLDVLGLVLEESATDDLTDSLAALAAELGVTAGAGAEETMAELIAARADARANKDWALADGIRDGVGALGIVIEDSADGARWFRR